MNHVVSLFFLCTTYKVRFDVKLVGEVGDEHIGLLSDGCVGLCKEIVCSLNVKAIWIDDTNLDLNILIRSDVVSDIDIELVAFWGLGRWGGDERGWGEDGSRNRVECAEVREYNTRRSGRISQIQGPDRIPTDRGDDVEFHFGHGRW